MAAFALIFVAPLLPPVVAELDGVALADSDGLLRAELDASGDADAGDAVSDDAVSGDAVSDGSGETVNCAAVVASADGLGVSVAASAVPAIPNTARAPTATTTPVHFRLLIILLTSCSIRPDQDRRRSAIGTLRQR
ncbi:hypothetical protein AB0F81_23535 [Actinoplanes sp. NPDC024001]|uniref:hypothetical protein n=1 Tax=Actinoplanes sp. NPDC024001 TaxID=3154598 RepID=UPI00340A9E80